MSARLHLALLVFAVIACPCRANAQTNPLVGTWQLVSAQDEPPNGKVTYPFGEHPAGIIVYDSTGHVSVHLMRAGRTKFAAFEDVADPAPSYVAYFGAYDVDAKTHIVTHHIQGHLDPKRIGTDNVRKFEIVGDRVVLIEMERPERHVTWRRIR